MFFWIRASLVQHHQQFSTRLANKVPKQGPQARSPIMIPKQDFRLSQTRSSNKAGANKVPKQGSRQTRLSQTNWCDHISKRQQYIYIHIYIYILYYIYMYIHIHTHMRGCNYMNDRKCRHIYMCYDLYVYICICVYVYMCVHTCVCTHTYDVIIWITSVSTIEHLFGKHKDQKIFV